MSSPAQLVGLSDVKAHLNLNSSDTTHDTELNGFIDAATAYIINQTGPINATTYTETHSGTGSTIVLRNTPVTSVTSVTEYVGTVAYVLTQSELGSPQGAYAFSLDNPQAGVLTRRYAGVAGQFASGHMNIVVTYVAGRGYVPGDVRMAVLQDIAGLYQPSQEGANPYYATQDAGNSPLNPIGMFPRVAEILSAPVKRTPSIA